MKCPQCGKDNPADNKFCDNCGLDLSTAPATPAQPAPAPPKPTAGTAQVNCPSCQHPNPADSTFCEQCGASLQPAAQATPAPPPAAPQVQAPTTGGILVLPDGTELAVGKNKTLGRVDLAKFAAPAETMWVSRQHLAVSEDNGVFYVQDDKSTNGTKLNGVEIKQQGRQQLKDGDEILVGDAVKLIFKIKA